MVQEEVGRSVMDEQTIRALASVEPGGLDEVGAGEGVQCLLEGHLEVESPEDEGLEQGGLQCPSKPGFVCQWRWVVGGERQRMVQEEDGPSVLEERTSKAVASV